MRSNPAQQLFFILQPEHILRSDLNYLISYGRLTDLKCSLSSLLVSINMAWRNKFTKLFTYQWGTFVQTGSTSFMSQLIKYFLFVLWSYLDDNLFLGFSCRSFGQELLFCSFVLYIFRQLLLDDFLVGLVRLIFDISNQFFV